MRICLVSREFPGFVSGGIGTYVAEAARAWTRCGHEVHVLTEGDAHLAEKGAKACPGVHFHRVLLDAGISPSLRFDAFPTWHMRYNMASSEILSTLHARHAFDYIEFPDYWGEGYFPLLAKRTRGAYAETVLSVRLHSPSRMAWELNRMYHAPSELQHLHHMEVTAMQHADALLSPSTSLLKTVQQQLGRCPSGHRVEEVLPYPLDPAPLDEVAARAREGAPAPGSAPQAPEVLYFGRLEHRKGVIQLVHAARHLLDKGVLARFRFIGGDTQSGPFGRSMREHLDRLARGLPEGAVVFEHSRPREQLAAAIAHATVCCFPSIWENFPNVCMEAMAQRSVVVGSRDGGMSQMIEHGRTGYLVAGADVADLARTLEQALALPAADRAAMGEAARASILRLCDPRTVVERTVELVEETRRHASARSGAAEAAWASLRAEAAARTAETGASWNGITRRPTTLGTPLVSIIVPFYNLAEFLPETLESVQRQTFRDFELIIINDGSTDPQSLSLLESLRARNLHVIDQHNRGLSNARNTGVAAARGRWTLPLDADDLLHETALEKLVEARVRAPHAAYSTCLVRYFFHKPEEVGGGWIPFGLDADVLSVRNCGGTPLCLMDREFLAEVKYDEWLTAYEDWDMYCSHAERGKLSVVVPEFLFYYRVRPQSMLRVDGIPKHDQLRSYLINKHPRLARDPSFATRLLFGEHLEQRLQLAWYQQEQQRLSARIAELEGRPLGSLPHPPHAPGTIDAMADLRAKAIIEENIRYRLADQLNNMLKSLGVQRSVKKVMGMMTESRP
ncbi:MAG: glycosyltransferase [Phycisphaerales bacterium]